MSGGGLSVRQVPGPPPRIWQQRVVGALCTGYWLPPSCGDAAAVPMFVGCGYSCSCGCQGRWRRRALALASAHGWYCQVDITLSRTRATGPHSRDTKSRACGWTMGDGFAAGLVGRTDTANRHASMGDATGGHGGATVQDAPMGRSPMLFSRVVAFLFYAKHPYTRGLPRYSFFFAIHSHAQAQADRCPGSAPPRRPGLHDSQDTWASPPSR